MAASKYVKNRVQYHRTNKDIIYHKINNIYNMQKYNNK